MTSRDIAETMKRVSRESAHDIALRVLNEYIHTQASFKHWEMMKNKYKRENFWWVELWFAPFHHKDMAVCLHYNGHKGTCNKGQGCRYKHYCLVCGGKGHGVYTTHGPQSQAYRCKFMARLYAAMHRLSLTHADVEALVEHAKQPRPAFALAAALPLAVAADQAPALVRTATLTNSWVYASSPAPSPSYWSPDSMPRPPLSTPSTPRSVCSSISETVSALSTMTLGSGTWSQASSQWSRCDSPPVYDEESKSAPSPPPPSAGPQVTVWAPQPPPAVIDTSATRQACPLHDLLWRALGQTPARDQVEPILESLRCEEIDLELLGLLSRENWISLGVTMGVQKCIERALKEMPPAYPSSG